MEPVKPLKEIEPIKEPTIEEIVRVLNELVEEHNENIKALGATAL